VQRRFKVTFTVDELIDGEDNPSRIASIGADIEAGSFKLALPKIQEQLNTQWSRIVGLADIVDADAFDTQDEPPKEEADAGGERPEGTGGAEA
jgi:hypothetical protein